MHDLWMYEKEMLYFTASRILILGGNQAYRTDSEIMDLTTESSSICTQPANIPDQHSKGAVGTFYDGRILLCGGWTAKKNCHQYSLLEQEWTRAPYMLGNERIEAAGAMLDNGSWLIIGGKGLDEIPQSSTEMLVSTRFMANLLWPEAVSGHCIEAKNSSHVFIAGGESRSGLLDTAYFLNLKSSFWISVEERMKHSRSGHVCGFIGNYGIIAGGFEMLQVELLNIVTLKWEYGPNLLFEMNWAASLSINDKFIILGGEHIGYCSKSHLCFASDAIFELDIANMKWDINALHTMKLPRSKHIVIPIDDNMTMCQKACANCKGKNLLLRNMICKCCNIF